MLHVSGLSVGTGIPPLLRRRARLAGAETSAPPVRAPFASWARAATVSRAQGSCWRRLACASDPATGPFLSALSLRLQRKGVARRASPASDTNTAQRRKTFPLYAEVSQGFRIPPARWMRPNSRAFRPARILFPFAPPSNGAVSFRPFFAASKKGRRPPGESGIQYKYRAAAQNLSSSEKGTTRVSHFTCATDSFPFCATQQWGRLFAPFLCHAKAAPQWLQIPPAPGMQV